MVICVSEVGLGVGSNVGLGVGPGVGPGVGSPVGVGFEVGSEVAGSAFGPVVGFSVGTWVDWERRGIALGILVGDDVVGSSVGIEVGTAFGSEMKVGSEVAGLGSEEVQSYSSPSSSVRRSRLRHRHCLLLSYVDFRSRRRGSQCRFDVLSSLI